MDPALSALLGALIGASAGVVGQIVTAAYSNRTERRRLAMDAGFREWQAMRDIAQATAQVQKKTIPVPPTVLFVHYNNELLKALESGGLTEAAYRQVMQRRDEIDRVIAEDNERRRESNV